MVREMMFAMNETFDYFQCRQCGCLQIESPPADLARYYGPGYYSYGDRTPKRGLQALLVRARNRHLSGRTDPLGWLLAKRRPFLALASLKPLHLPLDARILDVGCGSGELLLALQSAGFRQLMGVDPFIEHELDLGGGLRVVKAELGSLTGPFDVVMFHHSLEHIPDQQQALRAACQVLRPGGFCVVRIPTVSSQAWHDYQVDWCALDAPRHLYLHSRESIALLAQQCGLSVNSIEDDSTAFQFWGSEQYRRNIALMRPGCNDLVPAPGLFSDAELAEFSRRAQLLNQQHQGDQITVYLTRR
jgi:SAM-dependent methyltransferase